MKSACCRDAGLIEEILVRTPTHINIERARVSVCGRQVFTNTKAQEQCHYSMHDSSLVGIEHAVRMRRLFY